MGDSFSALSSLLNITCNIQSESNMKLPTKKFEGGSTSAGCVATSDKDNLLHVFKKKETENET